MSKALVDCGASDGSETEKLSAIHRPDAVYVFEPISFWHERLLLKAAKKEWCFLPRAVWISDGTVSMANRARRKKGHHVSSIIVEEDPLVNPKGGNGKIEEIPCVNFSKWLADLPEDDIIIKMDIEGAEYEVLASMMEHGVLDRVLTLYVEFHAGKMFHNARYAEIERKIRAMRGFVEWK